MQQRGSLEINATKGVHFERSFPVSIFNHEDILIFYCVKKNHDCICRNHMTNCTEHIILGPNLMLWKEKEDAS